ncbi:MAG: hypothetical protein WB611_29960 [Stellaceae bacterium]
MNLREFLEQRERELLLEIGKLQKALAPKEAELAEVRRAKAALGMTSMASEVAGDLAADEALLRSVSIGRVDELKRTLEEARADAQVAMAKPAESAAIRNAARVLVSSRNSGLTMKQLVTKALAQHFDKGASSRQLLEFFRDAWGRNIERTSLNPQLFRLYQDGIIGRVEGTKEWYLIPEERRGRKPYKRVSTRMSCGQIDRYETTVWLLPDEVTPNDEPLSEKTVAEPNLDED